MKVVVAMSGGVDSSTVAGMMVEAGHEVIGLAMKTHASEPKQNRACCTPDDMRDARRVADHFGIPFYVLNYEDLFVDAVITPFAEAYRAGKTPNPCVECNDKVKFKTMLDRAKLLGADKLATGHYARIGDGPTLLRGVDAKKDQSYFLYRLTQEQLNTVLFPLGGMTKAEVREEARRMGLSVAEKYESQEICFVGAEGYAKTVEKISGGLGGQPGVLIDNSGKVLGKHEGVHHFTLGQRRGLGISAAEPLYVTDIDGETGTVKVGAQHELLVPDITLEDVRWTGTPPQDAEEILVQQRYRSGPQAGRLTVLPGGKARVTFLKPEARGAPGQAAVIYRCDAVLGGGTIAISRTALPIFENAGVAP